MKKLVKSFKYAFEGLRHCVRYGRNFKLHILAKVLVIGAAFWFRVSMLSMALLLVAITLVIAAEMINTAIENAVDLFTDKSHPLAKTAKDAAAGAVLVTAVCAVCMGIIVVMMEVQR